MLVLFLVLNFFIRFICCFFSCGLVLRLMIVDLLWFFSVLYVVVYRDEVLCVVVCFVRSVRLFWCWIGVLFWFCLGWIWCWYWCLLFCWVIRWFLLGYMMVIFGLMYFDFVLCWYWLLGVIVYLFCIRLLWRCVRWFCVLFFG